MQRLKRAQVRFNQIVLKRCFGWKPADIRCRIVDHYAILGIDENASRNEVVKAYHKIAAAHHPDCLADCSAEEKERSKVTLLQAQESYKVLKTPMSRERYDRSRKRTSGDSKQGLAAHGKIVAQEYQRHMDASVKLRILKEKDPELFKKQQDETIEAEIRSQRRGKGGRGFHGLRIRILNKGIGSSEIKNGDASGRTFAPTASQFTLKGYDEWQAKLQAKRSMLNSSPHLTEANRKRLAEASRSKTREEPQETRGLRPTAFKEDRSEPKSLDSFFSKTSMGLTSRGFQKTQEKSKGLNVMKGVLAAHLVAIIALVVVVCEHSVN